MSAERLARVYAIFGGVVDLEADARDAALERACGGDAALRAEVEALLRRADGDTTARLRSPIRRDAAPAEERCADADRPPRIGRYRLVRLLGVGGMGEVHEATQEDPQRSVALKLIRAARISEEGRRRFAREAEALGRLRHPGIAHIYEAGVHEDASAGADGRSIPYLAMELVRGRAIVEAAREASMDVATRVELMAMVCDAVHHAHAQGVVHRDLKPANILLDDHGWPRVIDFGVARLLDDGNAQATLRTEPGQLVGTLAYMSPEQVSDRFGAVDARSDVYALGVVLFELLADALPLDLAGRSLPEAARAIQEEEPRRLSAIDHRLRGDLELVVATALAKEQRHRYQSAAALAADLRRALRDEPLAARPPGAIERGRRFVRRHRTLVATTLGIGAAMLAGIVGLAVFAAREAVLLRAAEREAYRAQLAEATAAVELLDIATARRALERAPSHLRGWEWRQLAARLDDSERAFPLGERATYGARFTHDGLGILLPRRHPADAPLVIPFAEGSPVALREGEAAIAWFRSHRFADPWLRRVDPAAPIGTASLPPEAGVADGVVPVAAWPVGIDGPIHAVTISEDGRVIVGAVLVGETSLVAASTSAPHEPRSLPCWTGGAIVRLDASGRHGILANDRRETIVWRVDAMEIESRLVGHEDRVLDAVFSPDLERVYTASGDGTVRSWRRGDGAPLSVGAGHVDSVLAVAVSADGTLVASGSRDGTVRLWDAMTLEPIATWIGHERAVFSVAFSPSGDRILSTSLDGTCRLWRTDCRDADRILRGHANYVYPIAFSPDGRRLASGSWDHTVRIWDLDEHRPASPLEGHAAPLLRLAWSEDGQRLASRDMQGRLIVWDPTTGRELAAFEVPEAPGGAIGWLNEHEVACAVTEGSIESAIVVDLRDGSRRRVASSDGAPIVADPRRPSTLGDGLSIERSEPTTLRIVDERRGHVIADLEGHSEEIFCWAVSPDGTRLVTAGRDRVIRVWDLATYGEVARLRGHLGHVWQLAFSPDGETLASSSGDYTVRLWTTIRSADEP